MRIEARTELGRAVALGNCLQARAMPKRSAEKYEREFERMWQSGNLDPLRPGDKFNTYYFRRASFFAGAYHKIAEALRPLLEAVQDLGNIEIEAGRRALLELKTVLDRIEPILALEVPGDLSVPPAKRPPSRWHQLNDAGGKRCVVSKKHVLGALPRDWDKTLWEVAKAEEWDKLEPLAVHLLTPVRAEEMVAYNGSGGVLLEMKRAGHLLITFAPVKSHGGRYGTQSTTFTLDPKVVGGPALFLAQRCLAGDGPRVVRTVSKDAVRNALKRLGKRALPEIKVKITPNVLRNQKIADLKATFGRGAEVPAGAGHGTDRTRAKYGAVQHGRKLEGYVSITAARPPRCENVQRGDQLAKTRKGPDKKRE